MDLDLSALVSMSQAQARCEQQLQPSTPTVMHSLVMSSIPSVAPQHASMLWPTNEDFNGYGFNEVMGLAPHGDAHNGGVEDSTCDAETTGNRGGNNNTRNSCANTAAGLEMMNSISNVHGTVSSHTNTIDDTQAQSHVEIEDQSQSQAPRMAGRKRRCSSVDENAESEVEVSKEEDKSCSLKTEAEGVYGDSGANDAGTSQLLCQFPVSVPTDIDPHVVCQMGGLAFAELCKERAREQFKERKKNEHLANGKFHRLKRRKKNDTSMSDKEKYVRRLQMNQDSAAAARYAHEVYIQVLEKLVKMSEEERGSFSMEMQRVRTQNEHLQCKVEELQAKVEELQAEESAELYAETKHTDPALAKIMDLLKGPSSISVDYSMQPARAV